MEYSQVINTLSKLNLSKLEASILISFYEYGAQLPSVIARKLDKNRITVYHACERLVFKGYLSKVNTVSGSKYYPLNIDEIVSKLEEEKKNLIRESNNKMDTILSVKSWIEGISLKDYKKPVTRLFQGKNALKEIYKLSLDTKELFAYFDPWDIEVSKELRELDDWHTKKRIEKKIPIKIILPSNKNSTEFSKLKKPLKQTLLIPKKDFPYKDFTIITEDKLLVYSSDDMIGISISSPSIAKNQRVVFNLIWNAYYNKQVVGE